MDANRRFAILAWLVTDITVSPMIEFSASACNDIYSADY